MKKLTGLRAIGAIGALSLMWASAAKPAVIPEMYNNGMNAGLSVVIGNCGSPANQPCWNNTLFQLSQSYVTIANTQPHGSDWRDTYYAVAMDLASYRSL